MLLVVNENAPRAVRAAGRARALLENYGAAVRVVRTQSVTEFGAVCEEARSDRIVLLGGDGTLHAAANLADPPELAVLPVGGQNNVARCLGIPLELSRAAALAVQGVARPVDAIEVVTETRRLRAIEGVSAGLHAAARARYRAPHSEDLFAGVVVGLRALRSFRSMHVELTLDSRPPCLHELGQLFVLNAERYAFGLRVAPGARPDDGLLHVVAIPPVAPRSVPRLIAALRRGTHERVHGVWRESARSATLVVRGSPIIVDTVALREGSARVTVAPAALRVVAP